MTDAQRRTALRVGDDMTAAILEKSQASEHDALCAVASALGPEWLVEDIDIDTDRDIDIGIDTR